jgi:hypothetical protein
VPAGLLPRLLLIHRSASRRPTLGRRTPLLASPSVEVADGRPHTLVPSHDPVAHRPKDAAERVNAGGKPRADNPRLTALDTDGNRPAGYVGREPLPERPGENAQHVVDRRVSIDPLTNEPGADQPQVRDTRSTVRNELEPQRAAELLNPGLTHRVRSDAHAVPEGINGRDKDDMSRVARHLRKCRPHRVNHAHEIDLDDVSRFLLRQFAEYLELVGCAPFNGFREEHFDFFDALPAKRSSATRSEVKTRLRGVWEAIFEA